MKRKLMLRNKSVYEEGMTTMGRTEMGRNSFQHEQNTTVFLCYAELLCRPWTVSWDARRQLVGNSHPEGSRLTQGTHSAGTQILSQVSRFGGQSIRSLDSKRHPCALAVLMYKHFFTGILNKISLWKKTKMECVLCLKKIETTVFTVLLAIKW